VSRWLSAALITVALWLIAIAAFLAAVAVIDIAGGGS
jgi:hypothetical protein